MPLICLAEKRRTSFGLRLGCCALTRATALIKNNRPWKASDKQASIHGTEAAKCESRCCRGGENVTTTRLPLRPLPVHLLPRQQALQLLPGHRVQGWVSAVLCACGKNAVLAASHSEFSRNLSAIKRPSMQAEAKTCAAGRPARDARSATWKAPSFSVRIAPEEKIKIGKRRFSIELHSPNRKVIHAHSLLENGFNLLGGLAGAWAPADCLSQ